MSNQFSTTEVIYITNDYSIFKKLDGNRSVKPKRIKEINDSVENVGMMNTPILVNEKMEIIDGQGRLEVCKKRNLPVRYTIQPGAGLKECQEMNLHTTNWSAEEMVISLAISGHDGCQKIKNIMNEFHVIASYVCDALNITRQSLRKQAQYIFITDEQYQKVRSFFCWFKKVESSLKKIPGRMCTKIKALVYCFDHGVDMDELQLAIESLDKTKVNATTIEAFLKTLQDSYNYNKKSKKNRIYVFESYRKGE